MKFETLLFCMCAAAGACGAQTLKGDAVGDTGAGVGASAGAVKEQYTPYALPPGTRLDPGVKYKILKNLDGRVTIAPLRQEDAAGPMVVLMPAGAANDIIASQTKVINSLVSKLSELEARIERLEGRKR